MRIKMGFMVWMILVLTGCASGVKMQNPIRQNIGQKPQINEEASATVGSVIFAQWNFTAQKFAYPSTALFHKFGLGATIAIPAGSPLVYTIKDGIECYCTTFMAAKDFSGQPIFGVCLVSNDSKIFDRYMVTPVSTPKPLDSPVQFTQKEMMVGENGFKYELAYLGIDGSSIKLAYREFNGNIIRPAFSQEVTYKIGPFPATISFRTLRFEVLGADNNTLRYRVLSGFEDSNAN